MNKTDLEQLADLRLAEAVALLGLTTPMPDGAYYLAGYAVECHRADRGGHYVSHDMTPNPPARQPILGSCLAATPKACADLATMRANRQARARLRRCG